MDMIRFLKDYVDSKFELNKLSNISIYKGEHNNETTYINYENKKYKLHVNKLIEGINNKSEGFIIAVNQTQALYLEKLKHYKSLSKLLDNINELMEVIIKEPIGNSSQGPVLASPALIKGSTLIKTQIEILKKELP